MGKQLQWVNILKGIGIISVVIGHSCSESISLFVYSYHLALFFFVSGFLYDEQKYGNNPYLNLGNRFKSSYWKYVIYSTLLYCSSVFWIRYNVMDEGSVHVTFATIKNTLLNSMVLNNTYPLFGPAWFVLALICGSGVMGFIITFANRVSGKNHNPWIKHSVIILLTVLCTYLGWDRFKTGYQLYARMDVGLYVMPIFMGGYYCRMFSEKIHKYVCLPGAVVSLGVLLFCIYYLKWSMVNLCGMKVFLFEFLVQSFFGIYLMVYISQKLEKAKYINKAVSLCGKYSFEIMCFHFSVFKLMDIAYCKLIHDPEGYNLVKIPYSYNAGFIYVIFGCAVPVIICLLCSKAKKYIISKVNK